MDTSYDLKNSLPMVGEGQSGSPTHTRCNVDDDDDDDGGDDSDDYLNMA